MSKHNRKRRRQNDIPKQNAAAIAQSIEQERDADLRLDELRPTDPFTLAGADHRPSAPIQQPRKFRDRTYVIGAFTVTVTGEEDALENEFWPRQEGEELVLLFGDAALEARISKQRPAYTPERSAEIVGAARERTFSAVQTSAPFDPRTRYPQERLEQSRRDVDAQDAALEGLGVTMQSLALDVGMGDLTMPDDTYGAV